VFASCPISSPRLHGHESREIALPHTLGDAHDLDDRLGDLVGEDRAGEDREQGDTAEDQGNSGRTWPPRR